MSRRVLPLSRAQTLPEAFWEWRWTGDAIDHRKCVETCGLCGQEELRYQYPIRNSVTRQQLRVGSKCILKFQIAVHDAHGRALEPKEARKRLSARLADVQNAACLAALEGVAQAENNKILDGAIAYWKKHGYLSPRLAAVVYWRLDENQIEYNPDFFKIGLRRKKHQEDLRQMETWRVHRIWRGLSAAQRKKAIAMGHQPPP